MFHLNFLFSCDWGVGGGPLRAPFAQMKDRKVWGLRVPLV